MPCVTHHLACDCREAESTQIRRELEAARAVVEAARTLSEHYGGEAREDDLDTLRESLAAYDAAVRGTL